MGRTETTLDIRDTDFVNCIIEYVKANPGCTRMEVAHGGMGMDPSRLDRGYIQAYLDHVDALIDTDMIRDVRLRGRGLSVSCLIAPRNPGSLPPHLRYRTRGNREDKNSD